MNSKTSRRDPNSLVQSGMSVNGGRITKKLADFIVIAWKVDGVECSGVLHVSEFPSLQRKERDAMFGVAAVGMEANGLVVLSTTPPKGKKRFTKVRLSALQPLKDALPPKPNSGGAADGQSKHRQPQKDPSPNHGKRSGGGNHGKRSGGAPAAQAAAGDGASNAGDGSAAAPAKRNGKPTQGKPQHHGKGKVDKGAGGGKPAEPKKPAPKKVTTAVLTPADPVAAARELIASVRNPKDTVDGFAGLARHMRLKAAMSDASFMARVRAIEEGVTFIDSCVAQRSELAHAHDGKVIEAASQVHATRKVDARLDEEAAALKSAGARYAGLCGQAKKDESKKACADELKSEIDRRREQLGKNRESNMAAFNDADFQLISAAHCGGAGSEDYEALVAVAAQLDKLQAEVAEKTKWLSRMVLRSERFLQPQPEGATVEAAIEAQGS